MKHLGDITKLKGSEVPLTEIVVGGSPCQDLSVAGKRKGLAGERSGLFMEQIRLIKEMRNESYKKLSMQGTVDLSRIIPRFMVWENVPGAFSSNNGEDFRAVLEETARVKDKDAVIPQLEGKQKWSPSGCIMGDGWSIAWRVHDAQFWGVPQRRKRISLVADFAGGGAPEILFERESVSWDTEESGKEGKGAAADAGSGIEETGKAISFQERAGCAGGGKGILIQNERTGALSTLNNQSVCAFEPGAASRVGGHVYEDGKAGTVRANAGDNQQAVVYGISAYESNAMKSGNPNSGIYEAETARTLDLNGGSPACNQGGMAVVQAAGVDGYNQTMDIEVAQPLRAADGGDSTPKVVCLEGNGSRESHRGNPACNQGGMAVVYRGDAITSPINASNPKPGDPCHTLTDDSRNYVVLENHPADSRVKVSENGMVQTLSSRMGTGGGNVPMVMELTNIEGEEISNTLVSSLANAPIGTTQDRLNVVQTYQDTTGSLCASGYDKLGTQEAMNDMFVVEGSSWDGSQTSPTLTANNAGGNQRMPDKDNFNAVVQSMEVFHCTNDEERGQTLKARDYKDPQVVAYGLDRASFNQGKNAKYDFQIDEEKIGCQVAKGPGAVCQSVVRRLTPLECERLQGYPDGWTDIGNWTDSKGKRHKGESDAPRYKALGNSIALPFWEWMAERMIKQLKQEGFENPTMASLFDGIGGFPLVFSRNGCKPIWASEIEEFPIAVTKIRFPEENK